MNPLEDSETKKKSKKEIRRQEVQENRALLKEIGFKEFFITPWIKELKEKPFLNLLSFFFYALVVYLIFSGLQAVYFDTIYCDALDDNYDGKLMEVYNDYIALANEHIETEKGRYETNDSLGNAFYHQNAPRQIDMSGFQIICKHNMTIWIDETMKQRGISIAKNFKKIVLKQK